MVAAPPAGCWVLGAPVGDRNLKCVLVAGEVAGTSFKAEEPLGKAANPGVSCSALPVTPQARKMGWEEKNNIQITRPETTCPVQRHVPIP